MSTPSKPPSPGALENDPIQNHGYKAWDRALDERFYDPDSEVLAFYKSETGIVDDEELKRHILALQKEAFAVCISYCLSLRLRIDKDSFRKSLN